MKVIFTANISKQEKLINNGTMVSSVLRVKSERLKAKG